jgi:hypothetical protein
MLRKYNDVNASNRVYAIEKSIIRISELVDSIVSPHIEQELERSVKNNKGYSSISVDSIRSCMISALNYAKNHCGSLFEVVSLWNIPCLMLDRVP